jgi:hypothetical protein
MRRVGDVNHFGMGVVEKIVIKKESTGYRGRLGLGRGVNRTIFEEVEHD